MKHVRYAEEEKLRQAFLWKEIRTPDKTGILSLLGTRYQVGPEMARRKIEVRYDPEALHEIEVWQKGRFVQRTRPFSVRPHRRPKPVEKEPESGKSEKKPTANWLSHLVEKRHKEGRGEPPPRQLVQDAQRKREKADIAVLDLLTDRLQQGVVDAAAVREFLGRFGPFDLELAEHTLDNLLEQGEPRDRHAIFYLEAIRRAAKGGAK
jgi:hypothetical protein